MFNIFLTVFFSTLAFAFVEPFFFIGYLISIALFGLYQAVFMANAGGAWDNAKKIVETELKMKNTPLHAGDRRRRHGRRPLQGHVISCAEPGHQIHDLVRAAGGVAGREPDRGEGRRRESRAGGRLLPDLRRLRVSLVLRDAHRIGPGLRKESPCGEISWDLCYLRRSHSVATMPRSRNPSVGSGLRNPVSKLLSAVFGGDVAGFVDSDLGPGYDRPLGRVNGRLRRSKTGAT